MPYNNLVASWYIDKDWVQPDLLDDAELELSVNIVGVEAPEMPIACESLDYNNTWLFYSEPEPLLLEIDVELEEGDGSLVGPYYGAAPITGSDDFQAISTSCSEPYCSYASFSESTGGDWSLDTMILFVDGTFTLSNGAVSEDIYNAHIELMGSALGTYSGTPTVYTIAAGKAPFLVSGEADGEEVTLPLTNSTAITATELTSGEWSFGSFQIEYVDDNMDTWTLTVNASTWLE